MSSISITLKVLETICSKKGGIALSEIANTLSMSPQRIAYYLKILQEEGYVYKDSHTGKYNATYKIVELGSRILANNELHEIAYPILLHLSERIHLTLHMAVKDGWMGVCILKVGSSKTMPSISRVGEVFDLYPTALGKVLLAWSEKEYLERYLAQIKLKPYTQYTVKSKEELIKQLNEIREKGYSYDEFEHRVGVRGVGVPVFDYTRKIVAAISALLLPHHDMKDVERIAHALQEASQDISAKLGYGVSANGN